MAIIAADSSGIILQNNDVWFVAVKRNPLQRHAGVQINRIYQNYAKSTLKDDWVEKLSAIMYYKAINTLYEESDCVQIDKDFLGKRREYVRQYMDVLFLVYRQNSPEIEFLSYRSSKYIKEAHAKTRAARYKQIRVDQNPNINKDMDCLKNYKF
jgi:hypothetical protein